MDVVAAQGSHSPTNGANMSFDLLAPHYRWMEAVLAGSKLQRCRTAFIDEVQDARHALIVGEGNGRFLSALLRANPSVRVLCVDGSARMLERARQRLGHQELGIRDVTFVQADMTNWSPPCAGFDLIVTHFFLDCFRPEQLDAIVARITRTAAPHARWLIADFCEPACGLARWRARFMLALMYWFFRVTTGLPARRLTPPDLFLERHGFHLQTRRHAEWGFLHTDIWLYNRTVEVAPDHTSLESRAKSVHLFPA